MLMMMRVLSDHLLWWSFMIMTYDDEEGGEKEGHSKTKLN